MHHVLTTHWHCPAAHTAWYTPITISSLHLRLLEYIRCFVVLMWGLSSRTARCQLSLQTASQRLSSVRHRHNVLPTAKKSTSVISSRQSTYHQQRRTLTSLLGGTILAMGFSTSSVSASTAAASVDTVGTATYQQYLVSSLLCLGLDTPGTSESKLPRNMAV